MEGVILLPPLLPPVLIVGVGNLRIGAMIKAGIAWVYFRLIVGGSDHQER